MDSKETDDIAIEAIEVFVNHILYIRGLFPAQIFKKRRVYNTPIYVSIFPPLNAYLYRVLRTARELKRKKLLQRLEVLFYGNEVTSYERYNFQITYEEHAQPRETDPFLLDFEEQLRTALYMLTERAKPLEKLPNDAKFKVLLHTTQAGFVHLSHDANYQDFPWLHESFRDEQEKGKIELLPFSRIHSVGINITAEIL